MFTLAWLGLYKFFFLRKIFSHFPPSKPSILMLLNGEGGLLVHIGEKGGKKHSSPGEEFLVTPLLPHLFHKFQIKQQEKFPSPSPPPPPVIIHSHNPYFEVSKRKIGPMNNGWAGKNHLNASHEGSALQTLNVICSTQILGVLILDPAIDQKSAEVQRTNSVVLCGLQKSSGQYCWRWGRRYTWCGWSNGYMRKAQRKHPHKQRHTLRELSSGEGCPPRMYTIPSIIQPVRKIHNSQDIAGWKRSRILLRRRKQQRKATRMVSEAYLSGGSAWPISVMRMIRRWSLPVSKIWSLSWSVWMQSAPSSACTSTRQRQRWW